MDQRPTENRKETGLGGKNLAASCEIFVANWMWGRNTISSLGRCKSFQKHLNSVENKNLQPVFLWNWFSNSKCPLLTSIIPWKANWDGLLVNCFPGTRANRVTFFSKQVTAGLALLAPFCINTITMGHGLLGFGFNGFRVRMVKSD